MSDQSTDRELKAQTVHAAKGRSIESMLLVVEPSARTRDRARVLCSIDEHGTLSPDDRDELRIGFVSITRAERYCAVALRTRCRRTSSSDLAIGFEAP